jgi:hypothetical protein
MPTDEKELTRLIDIMNLNELASKDDFILGLLKTASNAARRIAKAKGIRYGQPMPPFVIEDNKTINSHA